MPEPEVGQITRESTSQLGGHDRVKRGYWPEKFGDQIVSIDVDHPQARMVRTREQLEAEEIEEDRQAYEAECRKRTEEHEREQAEREAFRNAELNRLAGEVFEGEAAELSVSNSSTSSDVEKEEAPSASPASKPPRRSR